MSHADNCILSQHCTVARSESCNAICPSYIAMHGHNGTGGRSGAADLPSDYRMLSLTSSPAREEQSSAYALIDQYVATFKRQFETSAERIKSLYLYSDAPGTGKTTTASAILNEWLIVHYIGSLKRNRQPLQRPAYFLDVNEWQNDYNTFNRHRVPEHVAEPASARYYRKMYTAMGVPFAVLDDIGVRDATEAFRADLHVIINHRVTEGLPTVYTSNVPIAELERVFDKRLADRVRDMCAAVPFVGESRRGIR